jgi:hypothetical protein
MDEEKKKDDILIQQFESAFKLKRKTLQDLAYWDLYPTQVKRWLVYTKSPKGQYNNEGLWSTNEELTPSKEPFNLTLPREQNQEDWNKWEAIFQREQEQLPEHLRNVFRFGVTAEELNKVHPRLRRIFSLRNAPKREITSVLKQQLIKKWRLHDGDTGSSQVQSTHNQTLFCTFLFLFLCCLHFLVQQHLRLFFYKQLLRSRFVSITSLNTCALTPETKTTNIVFSFFSKDDVVYCVI